MVMTPLVGIQAEEGNINNIYTGVVTFTVMEEEIDILASDIGGLVGIELRGNRDKWDANLEGMYFPETDIGSINFNLIYTLLENPADIRLKAGPGYYFETDMFHTDWSNFFGIYSGGIGLKAGIDIQHSFTGNWDLTAGMNYRWVQFNEKNLDGIETSIGFSYNF